MRKFKFVVTMESTPLRGYVSEKVVNGALSGAVPIYFGAPDVTRYINEHRIVLCRLNRSVIATL